MNVVSLFSYLPYRVVRRFAIANICCFFAAEFDDLHSISLPDGMVFRELSAPMLDKLCSAYPEILGDDLCSFIESDRARGFAVFDGDSLVSFLWTAIENIPGAINHDGHLATQLPLYLPDGMGYVFSVYVMPNHRGQRLYGAMISELSNRLRSEGFRSLMLTTEGSNYRALRSVQRMGFRLLGRSMLFGIGTRTWAKYPSQPLPGGIQFGRYAGDTSSI